MEIFKFIPGKGDRLTKFVMSLEGVKIFYAVLGCFFIVSIPLIFAFFDGNFVNPNLTTDVVGDYASLMFYFIGFPTMLVTTIVYGQKFPETINELKRNNIINVTENGWKIFVNRANSIYSKWYINKLPYIVAIVITIGLLIAFRNPKNEIWYSLKTDEYFYVGGWMQLLVYFVTFYFIALCLLNIFASYKILKLLFSTSKIIPQPLHPDGCGGLASLGILSRKLIVAIILIGLILAINLYYNYVNFGRDLSDPLQVGIVSGYLIGAYIIFFLPLHAAHKPMIEAKEEELNLIHRYISKVNKKIIKNFEELRDVDTEVLKNFRHAKKMYDVASQMPVYPYNMKTIISFLTSVLAPILFIFLQKIIDNV